MLSSLYVRNYALISELKINFQNGFNAVTGETGAGKSIILGALSMVLGQKADNKALLNNDDKCIVEANFKLKELVWLTFFVENDLDFDGLNCIIRREINPAGKSRAFINDTPVNLQLLKSISDRLLDIHSQHQNLLLVRPDFQLEVLDMVSVNSIQLARYQQQFNTWKAVSKKLAELKEKAAKSAEELEYVQFQFQQLEDANLKTDELSLLEDELKSLTHSDEIKSSLEGIVLALQNDDAVLALIKQASNQLSKIREFIPEGSEWFTRLNSTQIELKDLADEMQSKLDRVEVDPKRLEFVENRLSDLYSLLQKFRIQSIDELIHKKEEFQSFLSRYDSYDQEIKSVEESLKLSFESMVKGCEELTETRKKHVDDIKIFLVQQLKKLAMPNVSIEIELSRNKEYTFMGIDNVKILFSANKNRELQELGSVASGGEISRIMLAVKSLIAQKSNLPAIIFDEVDTGVSGETANKMGDIMRQMSENMQVITITHLPQIAAKAGSQFKVFKTETEKDTFTSIVELTTDERREEIAQMLSGYDGGELALHMADELMKK